MATGSERAPALAAQRLAWPDLAKGIAILLVVPCHTAGGLQSAGFGDLSSFWATVRELCYAFMVPVFFFVSGWFAERSRKTSQDRRRAVLANLLYPYLLWTTVQTSLMIVTGAGNRVPAWSDLPAVLLGGWMQFWFLHTLILIFALDLLFRGVRTESRSRLLLAVSTAIAAGLGFGFGAEPLLKLAEHWVYFEVGVFLSSAEGPLPAGGTDRMAIFGGVTGLVVLHVLGAGYGEPLRPLSAICGIGLVLGLAGFLSSAGPRTVCRGLQQCGRYSLQIYILHVLVSATVRVGLGRAGVDDFSVHFLVGASLGVLLPLVLARVDEVLGGVLFRFPLRD